ncbi:hypothetical protein CJF32_00009227 [Rutstroemia sp. NJR-2017a WRK4]|nr:hypothetical protein CJF32_00009227 [Rutstroemia sp. NJR-2017a WRK4]
MEDISVSHKLLPPSAKRAKRVSTLDYNNWVWFDEQLARSVIQPVVNMGTGFIVDHLAITAHSTHVI